MIRMLLSTLFTCFLVNIYGFRINFNPTKELTKLSSAPNYNLLNLIKFSFKNEDFWPVLIGLRQSKLYNFPLTLSGVLEFLQCPEILEIVENERFPIREILTKEILNSDYLSECFASLPVEFFSDRLQINPIESKFFLMNNWGVDKTLQLLKSSLNDTNYASDWYSWIRNNESFSDDFAFPTSTWPWIWKIISYYTINVMPDASVLHLLNIFSFEYNENANQFYRDDHNIHSSLKGVINLTRMLFTGEEIDFSRDQIMKIITVSILVCSYPRNHEIHRSARIFLLNSLTIFNNGRRKFPLRKQLKRFIRNVIETPSRREPLHVIQDQLLDFAEHLKGFALGPWLLNVFLLWTHFNLHHQSIIRVFIEPFTRVFFAKETSISASDVCLLFQTTNTFISSPDKDQHHITSWIIDKHVAKKPALAREIFKQCPNEIPQKKRKSSELFPLEFRLQELFSNSRYISSFSVVSLQIILSGPPEQVCLRIFKEVDDRTDFSVILPMNSKILSRNVLFERNLPGLLTLFFHNLMFSNSWFTFTFVGRRPTILPNLSFPPQLMEFVGILLGQAVVSNVKIPFLLDRRYFSLPDIFDSETFHFQSISSYIQDIYPQIPTEYNQNDCQIYRIISSLHFSASNMIDKLGRDFRRSGRVEIGPFPCEPDEISNSISNTNRIILMGTERLRNGINLVIPASYLGSEDLYKLIFKE